MKIYLIGYMGSGKTTIGKKLAKKLSLDFADTDVLFEQKYEISIADFFNKYGEEKFRQLENAILHETIDLENIVIATGGGMPCFFDNMDVINQSGISVYLKANPKSVLNRLKNGFAERPILQNIPQEEQLEFIINQLKNREVFYSKAKVLFKSESINIYELADCLKKIEGINS